MSVTMRDHYGDKGTKVKPSINPAFLGPQVILYDNSRVIGWDILAHGGFLTYPHHDADGYNTFVYPRSGAKVWAIIRIKKDLLSTNRDLLFNKFDSLINTTSPNLDDSAVMGTILLEEDCKEILTYTFFIY